MNVFSCQHKFADAVTLRESPVKTQLMNIE